MNVCYMYGAEVALGAGAHLGSCVMLWCCVKAMGDWRDHFEIR